MQRCLYSFFTTVWLTLGVAALSAAFAIVKLGSSVAAAAFIIATTLVCALLLWRSIANLLRRMESATGVIAGGGFDFRINSSRRDAFGSLSSSIDAMAQRLEDLELSRKRMLAVVSHELRTPLTVMRGEAYTLSRTETDERRLRKYKLIDAESERLAALIDDLLTAATLRATRINLHRENIAVDTLLDGIESRFVRAAADVGVVLQCDNGDRLGELSVDRRRFEQIVSNLITNAISHAPNASTVMVRAVRRATVVRFSVRNGGPAINQNLLNSIFEPFAQGERPTGTVGLGLAIARDLARAHGGDLAVRSKDGNTTFWFDLPAGRIQREALNVLAPRLAT